MCDIFDWTREEYQSAPRTLCNWALAFHRVESEAVAKRARGGNG